MNSYTIRLKFALVLAPLAFCTTFVQATTLTSWNIEWLSSTPSKQFEESQRDVSDFDALARHFQSTNSDVLAFQEVNDLRAIQSVVGKEYKIVFSDRSEPSSRTHQFEDINQYTGIAIRKEIPFRDQPDLQLDGNPNSKLRFATYVVLYPDSKRPIHVLSLHLKSRCAGQYKNNRHCKTLKSQGAAINHWLRERDAKEQAYIVLGDFNHNLSYPNDWLWNQMSGGTRAILATRETQAKCKVRSKNQPAKLHQFRSLIDHIIVSNNINYHSVKQATFINDEIFKYRLSDHCPIQFTVN